MKRFVPLMFAAFVTIFFLILGCGTGSGDDAPQTSGIESEANTPASPPETVAVNALIVVSPHPDDESIMAAGTIYRACHAPDTVVSVVYLSSGDAAGGKGKCNEENEGLRRDKIVALRESETINAWKVLGLDKSGIHFLRYPDKGLVTETNLVGGKRMDSLNDKGKSAVSDITALVQKLVPPGAKRLTIISGSVWDGHPDHRVDYYGARSAAFAVSTNLKIPVVLLSAIVHDEFIFDPGFCCVGDLFWPNKGQEFDYNALANSKQRPRPPKWEITNDISDLGDIKTDAISAHVSQVKGWPELCMTVALKEYYRRWMEKTEEVFYKEDFPAGE